MGEQNTSGGEKKTLFCLLILLACCLAAYWPLTFHVFSLKNDALNYFLPVRYQISESISNGFWPLWSPYFNLGYPLHGDMQSGVWNPFVQLLSLLGPYTLKVLQYEVLLYVYLSGVGMFFLARHFIKDWRVCLLAGVSFMLCSYNSDSAQFLNWISAASFLPFVFLFYYRTLRERSWLMALCSAIFLYLLFTTAYPADFILTAYLLVFLFAWHIFSRKHRTKENLKRQVLLHALILACFLLLSLPSIISYAEFLSLTERGKGASYERVMSNPLHPALLFTYLTPLPAWKASFASVTDPLTRNSFFGLIPFTFFILSFFIKAPDRLLSFLRWGFVIATLFSFGEWGGLRILAYYVLPLFDTFRHPSNARLFSIFFACLLFAYSFRAALEGRIQVRSRKLVWMLLIACLFLLLLWAFAGGVGINAKLSTPFTGIKQLLDRLDFSDLLFINILLQLPFVVLLYYFFVRKVHVGVLLAAGIVNCMIHTMLFQPFTVVKKDRAAEIQGLLNRLQTPGYPFPDLNKSLAENSREGNTYFEEIGAGNMYSKKIGRIDYRITPSNLLLQNEFWRNEVVRTTIFEYPVFYRADTAINVSDSIPKLQDENRKVVFVGDQAPPGTISSSPDEAYHAEVVGFTPNFWKLRVDAAQPGNYVLLQNFYPRWELFVNGKRHPLQVVNISFMGFSLPEGRQIVEFRYRKNDLVWAFYISLASLICIIVLIGVRLLKPSLLPKRWI